MSLNGDQQIAGAAIMQEIDALADPPKGSRTELVTACRALGNVVCQTCTHMMEFEV